MSNERIRFFPAGNGDTTLIEYGSKTILTDVNYRDQDSDHYDFAPDLLDACRDDEGYRLSLFVLTHPDKDHLGGFSKLFHCGAPSKYHSRPESDNDKILVDEIWISPYSEKPNYETEASAPVFKEIKRRLKLQGTDEGNESGNRIQVLDLDSEETSGSFAHEIQWRLLAPNAEEASVEDDGSRPSSNNTSLVIQWKIGRKGEQTSVLLGGDADVSVWERIWTENRNRQEDFSHHILLAPHHCSRTAFAQKTEDGEYSYSDDAQKVFEKFEGDGFVVSSSKEIKDDDDNPPSWEAKGKYLKMLKEQYAADHEQRFLNPETHNEGEAEPVEFRIEESGPVLKALGQRRINIIASQTIHATYG